MSNDPRARLRTILSGVTATEDDNATPATIQIIYDGGPEVFRYMFYTASIDVVISMKRHREVESGDQRRVQDVPIRYDATIPFSVNAVDKTGLTATKVLNKVRLSIIAQIEANAQDSDYTWILRQDDQANMRKGGLVPLWQDNYTVFQRPMIDS